MAEHWHFNWPTCAHPLFVDGASATLTVGCWAKQLAACRAMVSTMSGPRVLLYQDDSVQFSLWLFALLQAGKTVILPPNGLSETLAQAAHHADEQVLPDTAVPHSDDDDPLFDSPQLKGVDISLPFNARIVFFTSGSSGQRS